MLTKITGYSSHKVMGKIMINYDNMRARWSSVLSFKLVGYQVLGWARAEPETFGIGQSSLKFNKLIALNKK